MKAFPSWIRVIGFAIAGAAIGYLFALFLLGVSFIGEDVAMWMGIIGAANGAGAAFGWENWVALANDAADVSGEENTNQGTPRSGE